MGKIILIIKTVCIDISTNPSGSAIYASIFLAYRYLPSPRSAIRSVLFLPRPAKWLIESLSRRSRYLAVVCKIVNSCRPCGLCQFLAGGYPACLRERVRPVSPDCGTDAWLSCSAKTVFAVSQTELNTSTSRTRVSVVAQLRVCNACVMKGAFQREAQMTQCKDDPTRSIILSVLTNTNNITDRVLLILLT